MTDRLIDLHALLNLVASRSDYVRIVRSCLHQSSEQDDDNDDHKNSGNGSTPVREINETELCPVSGAALELHNLLFSYRIDQLGESSVTHFLNPHAVGNFSVEAMRALLALPIWSKAPWNAAKSMILKIQKRDTIKDDLHTLQMKLADLQIFLSNCHLQNPYKRKYGKAILKELTELFYIIMKPSLSGHDESHHNSSAGHSLHIDEDGFVGSLSLLEVVMEAANRFQDTLPATKLYHVQYSSDEITTDDDETQSTFMTLLDCLVPVNAQSWIQIPDMVLPLLTCISRYWHRMSSECCARLQLLLDHIVQQREPCIISERHVCEFFLALIPMISHDFSSNTRFFPNNTNIKSRLKAWGDIYLRFFALSYEYSPSTLFRIESTVASSLASLPSNVAKDFISCIMDSVKELCDVIPSIRVNMVLNILQHEHRVLPKILTVIDEESAERNHVIQVLDCFLILSRTVESQWPRVLAESNITFDGLQSIIRGIRYVHDPMSQFRLQNEALGTFFDDISELLFASFGSLSQSLLRDTQSWHASMWISTMTRILDCSHCYHMKYCHVAFMISAIAIVFWKYPAMRYDIVHLNIIPKIGGKQPSATSRSLYLSVVTAILNGFFQDSDSLKKMIILPLLELLQFSISQGDALLAVGIVLSISHTKSGKKSVGVMVKDYYEYSAAWASDKEIKIFFDIITLLLLNDAAGEPESEHSVDPIRVFATITITNLIVCKNPHLSHQLRYEIIRSLTTKVERMNDWSFERIFHAILFYTLSFFQVEKWKDSLKIIPIESCKFPLNLRFVPYIGHECFRDDELISLIGFICFSLRARCLASDENTMNAFLMTVICSINRSMDLRETDLTYFRRMEKSTLFASLFLRGIVTFLLNNPAGELKGWITVDYSSSFQAFLIQREKLSWQKVNVRLSGSEYAASWWGDTGKSISLYLKPGEKFTDQNDMSNFSSRLCLLLIRAILDEINPEYSDNDMNISETHIELIAAVCILLGRPNIMRDHLSSLYRPLKSDDDYTFTGLTFDAVKRFLQITCALYQYISSQHLHVSENALHSLCVTFPVLIDITGILKYMKDANASPTDIDNIVASLWDIYYIFVSDDHSSVLFDNLYRYVSSNRSKLKAYQRCEQCLLTGNESRRELNELGLLIKGNLFGALQSFIRGSLVMTREKLPFFIHIISTFSEEVNRGIPYKCEGLDIPLYDETVKLLIESINKVVENMDELNDRHVLINLSTLTFLRSNLVDSACSLWKSLINNNVLLSSSLEPTIFVSIYVFPKLIRRIDIAILPFPLSADSMTINPMHDESIPLAFFLDRACPSQYSCLNDYGSSNDSLISCLKKCYQENGNVSTTSGPKTLRSNFCLFGLVVVDNILLDAISSLTFPHASTEICLSRLVVYSSNNVKILAVIMFHIMCMSQFASSEGRKSLKFPVHVTKPWKKKFYSCIDHLFLLILHSMRLVRRQIRTDVKLASDSIEDSRLGDATAYLIVWFYPIFDSFVLNIEQMYDIEVNGDADDRNRSGVLEFQKIFHRLEDLERERLKVIKNLRQADDPKVSLFSLVRLFECVSREVSVPFSNLDRLFTKSFKTNIILQSNRLKMDQSMSRNKSKRLKTHEMSHRNNPLINEWLDLDKTLIERGEGGLNDAFEDLNDFIVEG